MPEPLTYLAVPLLFSAKARRAGNVHRLAEVERQAHGAAGADGAGAVGYSGAVGGDPLQRRRSGIRRVGGVVTGGVVTGVVTVRTARAVPPDEPPEPGVTP